MGGPYLCPDYQRARGLHFHRATNEIAVAGCRSERIAKFNRLLAYGD